MFGNARKAIFTDAGPELDRAERNRAIRLARRAATEAQGSLTLTAKRQYRRYRADAGEKFMAWPQWHEHYLASYGTSTSGSSGDYSSAPMIDP
ncbi:hypothetical protein QSJ18_03440 [Gordonia sp. ABSL1-1]|uniref:hypothetical protein n=1 Tax=Gordonia sp. ABSL1-1 TaxID=3053923 RepID=UPI002573035F|nr:hypothetical protein [Gordonia sp. ABSL1-1]MDL9935791.1 hypothetical protein [Gordonia sp. ABSL1-1]